MEDRDLNVVIPIVGLSNGEHNYSFSIGNSFFEQFGNEEIKSSDIAVDVVIKKSSAWMGVTCSIYGSVVVECDRCLEDLSVEIDVEKNLTVRFVEEAQESEDDQVMLMERGEPELNLDQVVYDFVCLSLPLIRVHPDGECNAGMIAKLNQVHNNSSSDEENDSPFSALKDLFK